MSWSKLHGGAHRHRKVLQLESRLGCSELEARGIVLTVWSWTIESEPDGDLDGWTAEALARVWGWRGDAAVFVEALVGAGLLDEENGALRVHDWMEHAEGWKDADRKRKERQKKRRAPRPENVQDASGTIQGLSGKRPPERRGEEKRGEEDCAAPPSQAPSVISVPCSGGKSFAVTQSQIDRWKELFPAVDVLTTVRRAVAWAEANPRKRKTAARMASWLATVWLARAQDEGGERPRYGVAPTQQSSQPPSASIDDLPPLPASYFVNQRKAAEPQTALAIVSNGNGHVKK
ncbi:MAG: hypothetical protein IPG93_24585 [Burkholderiales bacterium]|nr:hypothetical protein [Burkholderiales bacterium]